MSKPNLLKYFTLVSQLGGRSQTYGPEIFSFSAVLSIIENERPDTKRLGNLLKTGHENATPMFKKLFKELAAEYNFPL